MSTSQSDRLKSELRETMKVVDTCLESIYTGDSHMYRPLAGQLRIILCDFQKKKNNSLLYAAYPSLTLNPLKAISWRNDGVGDVGLRQSEGDQLVISQMPFEITLYSRGLAVADLEFDKSTSISISAWSDQKVIIQPDVLTVSNVIREVADKGGGSHVDKKISRTLASLYERTPFGQSYAQLLILAFGRMVQQVGEKIFEYNGCKVNTNLSGVPIQKINLLRIEPEDRASYLDSESGLARVRTFPTQAS